MYSNGEENIIVASDVIKIGDGIVPGGNELWPVDGVVYI